jgi:hypothetical protein
VLKGKQFYLRHVRDDLILTVDSGQQYLEDIPFTRTESNAGTVCTPFLCVLVSASSPSSSDWFTPKKRAREAVSLVVGNDWHHELCVRR